MKRIIFFVIIIIVPFFYACSPLTKSQATAVNQFFETVNDIPSSTKQLNAYAAKVKLNRMQLYAGTYKEDSLMIELLVSSFDRYRKELEIQDSLLTKLNEMDRFAKSYFSMLPGGVDFVKILQDASVTIGSFFGLRNIISSAFVNIRREVKISPKRAKKIKKHLQEGNKLINDFIKSVNIYIEHHIDNKLGIEEKRIKGTYRKFLKSLESQPDSYEYYSRYNSIFIHHYRLMHHTGELSKQLKTLLPKLKMAYDQLIKNIEHRKKIDKEIKAVQDLYLEVQKMRNTILQLNKIDYEAIEPGYIEKFK